MKFKVGDRVKIIHYNRTGVITEVYEALDAVYEVRMDALFEGEKKVAMLSFLKKILCVFIRYKEEK